MPVSMKLGTLTMRFQSRCIACRIALQSFFVCEISSRHRVVLDWVAPYFRADPFCRSGYFNAAIAFAAALFGGRPLRFAGATQPRAIN